MVFQIQAQLPAAISTIFGFSISWYFSAIVGCVIITYLVLSPSINLQSVFREIHVSAGSRHTKRAGVPLSPLHANETFDTYFFQALVVSVIGSRLGYIFLVEPAQYFRNPARAAYIFHGGTVYAAGFLSSWYFLRKRVELTEDQVQVLCRLSFAVAGILFVASFIGDYEPGVVCPIGFLPATVGLEPRFPAAAVGALSCLYLATRVSHWSCDSVQSLWSHYFLMHACVFVGIGLLTAEKQRLVVSGVLFLLVYVRQTYTRRKAA